MPEDPAVLPPAPESTLPPSVIAEDQELHICNLVSQGMSLADARKLVQGVKPTTKQSASQLADAHLEKLL